MRWSELLVLGALVALALIAAAAIEGTTLATLAKAISTRLGAFAT